MAEYIKREEVIEITAETGALETQTRVMDLPSIDIVHCKDCVYYKSYDEDCECTKMGDCKLFGVENMNDDDYCSIGETEGAEHE